MAEEDLEWEEEKELRRQTIRVVDIVFDAGNKLIEEKVGWEGAIYNMAHHAISYLDQLPRSDQFELLERMEAFIEERSEKLIALLKEFESKKETGT